MTKAEIIKKLGRIPRNKNSSMYKMYFHPEQHKKEMQEQRQRIGEYQKSDAFKQANKKLTSKEQIDYQRRTGRGWHE